MKVSKGVKAHAHVWVANGSSSKTVLEACSCGERQERPATAREARAHKAMLRRMFAEGKATHRVWGDVAKRFKSGPYQWKERGYELMEQLEAYALKHPEIHVVGVDDSAFTNSDLVFVPHSFDNKKLGSRYMGTSVVFIAQCAGDDPVEFFLYPGHLRKLIVTLQAIEKEQNRIQAKGRKQGRLY